MPRQRTSNDCVVAAVATATGSSYVSVKRIIGSVRGGLEPHEVAWLLDQVGDWRRQIVRDQWTAKQWAVRYSSVRAVLIVHSGMPWEAGHAVAAVDGQIFNPADGGEGDESIVRRAYVYFGPANTMRRAKSGKDDSR